MSGGLLQCELQRLRAVGRQRHLETLKPQRAANRVTQCAVIINEQNLADRHGPSIIDIRRKNSARNRLGVRTPAVCVLDRLGFSRISYGRLTIR